jgi:hypothetical protein
LSSSLIRVETSFPLMIVAGMGPPPEFGRAILPYHNQNRPWRSRPRP